jgi:hypothetical protein
VVSDFEPGDIGAPTGYPLGNPPQIKKDTAYTLKCWDGTDDTNPAIATGVCRVSTKQGEFN